MKVIDTIKARRTIRKFKDENLPEIIVRDLIEAARWAPSAHNLQPWKFLSLMNIKKIRKISDILNVKANDMYSGFNIIMRDTAKNIKHAKHLILVYGNENVSKKFSRVGEPYSEIGKIFEIQSITTAIENMLLYAHELNIGIAWYGMPLFCEKEINKILNQNGKLMAVLSLGYPDEKPKITNRNEISTILEIIR